MSSSIERYVEYVEDQIQKFVKYSNLIDSSSNEVTALTLNTNLANYTNINVALNGEYQRKKCELARLEAEYQAWYDQKFVEMRRALQEDQPRSVKISIKEIEAEMKVAHAKEYSEWQEKITAVDLQVQFVLRLLEQWKTHSQILIAISQNMRTEIQALSVEDRVNDIEKMRTFDSAPAVQTRRLLD